MDLVKYDEGFAKHLKQAVSELEEHTAVPPQGQVTEEIPKNPTVKTGRGVGGV
jgi:hypothetical protein